MKANKRNTRAMRKKLQARRRLRLRQGWTADAKARGYNAIHRFIARGLK
jgi:hypothetical protein